MYSEYCITSTFLLQPFASKIDPMIHSFYLAGDRDLVAPSAHPPLLIDLLLAWIGYTCRCVESGVCYAGPSISTIFLTA